MLDPTTLMAVNAANVLVVAAILPWTMGRLGPAAMAARHSLMLNAGGWLLLLVATALPDGDLLDRVISALSMLCYALAHRVLLDAFSGWMGSRPGRMPMNVLTALIPLGYVVLYDSYSARVLWTCSGLAMQMLILAWGMLAPSTLLRGKWRYVVLAVMLAMAFFTFGRAMLAGFFTEAYPSILYPHPFNIAAMVAANVTLMALNVALLIAWHDEAAEQLRQLALTDRLTGLFNRRGWDERGGVAVTTARRYGYPVALLLIDIDHFKRINDSRGHAAGDEALRFLGAVLREMCRASDIAFRLGGEEFGVLLPHTSLTAGMDFDRRLRAVIASRAQAELGFSIDYSGGLAQVQPDDSTVELLVTRADALMYAAKQAGRGRTLMEG